MIAADQEAQVLRLYHAEKWGINTIARQLGLHHSTVQRVLVQGGVTAARDRSRPSKLEPYVPLIQKTLEQYPSLTASRLYQMARERGYLGSPDHFRHVVALYRPRPAAEAYLRLRTLMGEQAQVDWASFGKLRIGSGWRPLMGFVMVLSWSRQIFLRFFLNARIENFLRGHQAAFSAWKGCPRVLLYDNLKSAVLERVGNAIRFNPTLLAFAAHYRFEPRPVAVARGNEKGRVEKAIRFARDSFFAGRTVEDLDTLNAQATDWCEGLAAERRWPEDRTLAVGAAFLQERAHLMALPENGFPTEERLPVAVGKTPYIRFDGNDYSIPHTHVRRTLVVVAGPQMVRVFDGSELLATHYRCYGHHDQIEDPAHIAALVDAKRQASQHRGVDRLRRAVPRTEQLYARLAARGEKLSTATAALLRLLDQYGPTELDRAIEEALTKDSPHPHTIRLVLERHRQGQPPCLPLTLPDDPRLRDLVVRPHDLSSYDELIENEPDDPTDDTTN
jgi:transposase